MRRLVGLLGFALLGLLVARVTSVDPESIHGSTPYLYTTSLLLGVGLYGSTFAIETRLARADLRIILLAVTVGVFAKAVLIGGVLALAWGDPIFLILGVTVAQIDPLSVATLMGDTRMSPRAKTILAAWASFDDPLTVVLAVYASAIASTAFGLGESSPQGLHIGTGLARYAIELSTNLIFAAVAYALWRLVRRHKVLPYVLLGLVAVVAVWQFLMLGLALTGLFLRPAGLTTAIARLTRWALGGAAILLGVLLAEGMAPAQGLALGLAAFLAQVIISPLLTVGLPRSDRFHLAFAQQNGITAIILALRLESQFTGVVGVVAPAILATNLIYLTVNGIANRALVTEQIGDLARGPTVSRRPRWWWPPASR